MYSSKLFILFLLLFGSLFPIAIAHPSPVSGYTPLEPSIVSVEVSSQAEEGGEGFFFIQLSSPLGEGTTLHFSLSGTATVGEDYVSPGESVFIPAGEITVPVSIAAVADELIEYDETVILTLLDPEDGEVQLAESPGHEAEMNIVNIGTATAKVRVLQHTGEGSAEPGKFEITLDKAVQSTVNLEYSLSGTATSGEDFNVVSGHAVFQAGEVSSIVTFNAIDDEVAEGTESIELLLEQTDHPHVEVENSAENQLLEIVDNDPFMVSVIAGEDAAEEDTNGSFIFELERELDVDVMVEFNMSGSATETEDYQPTGGAITIPANATRYSLPIAVLDDDQEEGVEAVVLTITNINSDGLVVADPVASEAEIAILDNDESATLSVFVEREVSETETSGGFEIRSSVALAQPLTIRYLLSGTATEGKDYNANDGELVPEQEKTIVLEANSTTVSLPIMVVDDELVEEKESIKIELLGVEENGMATISEEFSTAQLEISDNDAAQISVQKEQDGAEGGAVAVFRISSTTAIAFNQTIVFDFSGTAEEGADYTFSGGGEPASQKTVVLEKEQTDLLVNLSVEDDAKVEGTENVVLSLQEVPGEGAVSLGEESEAVLLIRDNDAATLSVGVEQEGSENSPEGRFRILSSDALQEDVTIRFTFSGTASEVDDFTIPAGILLANNGNESERMAVLLAGTSNLDIPLTIEDDELVEENETIRLSLLETGREDMLLSPTASIAEMTILDNDEENQAPVANAGENQTIQDADRDGEEEVALNGSESNDPDGSIESYSWSINQEVIATGISPKVTLATGTHTITLTVTDDQEATATDDVEIIINAPANVAPVANAGNDQTVTDADRNGTESITLDGSGSTDEDGSIGSYSWSIDGVERATGVSPTFDLEVGTHIITLTVTDNDNATDTDDVKISINAPENQSPTASAGDDKNIPDSDRNGVETVDLDGSGSSDPDGTITAYSWSIGGEEVATGVNPSVELEVGTYTIQLKVTDDGDLSATDDVEITISTPANQKPIANAGKDQTIMDADRNGEEKVVLDGSDSSDSDGRIVSYSWRVAGVEKATGAKPTLMLPQGNTTVQLEVKDDGDLTDTDEVNVMVNAPANQLPVANAGESRTIQDGDRDGEEEVTLDGSGSSDPDGSIQSYSWSIGEEVIASGINPEVTLATGTHTITLTVTDDQEGTATDDVEIIVNTPENQAPTANAGSGRTITDTDRNGIETVSLDGSGSSDPDGTITSYSWRVGGEERTTGMNTTLDLGVGTHTVTLIVTDNNGATDSDEIQITINAPANIAPVANAGNDQTVVDADRNGKESVTLNGSGSTDEDGTISSYSWSVNGVVMATGVNPGIDLGVGTHTVILTVTDNDDATDTDEVKITVSSPANQLPTANAGPDQTLTDTDRNGFESVTLDGSDSSDPDGRVASFSWRINGDEKATGEKPTIVLERGTYTVELIVTDNNGAQARDEVTITVNAPDNKAPTANAGADQALTDLNRDGQETVTLNGSESRDPDGTISRYVWTIDGKEVAQGPTPIIILPVGTHTVVLTVTDNGGLTASDQVSISIRQSAVLSIAPGSDGSEGGANGSFVLNSSMALNQDITVRYSLGGVAVAGSDYTSPGTQVVLRAGETSVTIPIQVIDDEEVEREETVILTLTGVSGSQDVVLGETKSATISIGDNEGCFTIREELRPASCSGTADGRINLSLTGASDNVTFSWSNGFAGEDLQNVPAGDYQVVVTDQVSGCRLVQDYTLEVEDNTPPVAKVRRVSISLNQNGQASLQAQNLNDGSSDNCGIRGYSVNKTSFSCADIGENEVTLTVEDVNGNTASTRATVVVEDNQAPVFASNQQFSISEDATPGSQVGTVEATDNCQSIAWEIVAGNDDGLFGINQEGQITTLGELDYESRISYNLTIRARAGGLQAIEVVSVMLLNVDEAGPDIGTVLEGTQSVQEDGMYSFEIPADAFEVPENEEISYSVQGLPSWMTFNENTLRLEGTPGNEDVGVYHLTIRGTDSQGLYAEQSFSLEVSNTNDAPHSLTLSRNQVQENQPVGTFIGHLTHEDVDTGDAHTYHFASGEGDTYNSYFSLNGADLLTAEVLDYETDTLVTIRLAVTDRAGASFEEVFRIEVGNDENGAAFLPNLFSPNGDKMNDYFVLKASRVQELHWRIYNRQGRVVYETRDVGEATQTGWDGRTAGEPQPEGSYMWVLEAYDQDGSPLLIDNRQKGNVTLIR